MMCKMSTPMPIFQTKFWQRFELSRSLFLVERSAAVS